MQYTAGRQHQLVKTKLWSYWNCYLGEGEVGEKDRERERGREGGSEREREGEKQKSLTLYLTTLCQPVTSFNHLYNNYYNILLITSPLPQ